MKDLFRKIYDKREKTKVASGAMREYPMFPAMPPGRPPNIDWVSVVDSHLWNHHNKPAPDDGRRQGVFHPSAGLHSSIGNCPRQIIFDLLCSPKTPTRIPANLRKILDNGTNRHVGLEKYFYEMADLRHMGIQSFEGELAVEHPVLPIYGHADGRVGFTNGWRYIIDFKTASPKSCAKMYEPEFKHRVQINTYMGCLGERAAYVIVENKEGQKWLGPMNPNFRVDFDAKLFEETEEYCIDILTMVKNETIPDFDQTVCNASLTFCAYQGVCDQQRTVQARDTQLFPDHRNPEIKRRHLEVIG
jgi:hypothetical protein